MAGLIAGLRGRAMFQPGAPTVHARGVPDPESDSDPIPPRDAVGDDRSAVEGYARRRLRCGTTVTATGL